MKTSRAQFEKVIASCDKYARLMAPEWRIRYEHKVDDKQNGAEVDRNN